MSNDGYTHIKKADDGTYILYAGVASNDHRTEMGVFDNLESAVKAAQDIYTEYGLSFDLGNAPSTGQIKQMEDKT